MTSSESRQSNKKPRSNSRTSSAAGGKAAELRRLVQKKERLKYTVERLELQSTQKQRQLRKSMAVQ